MSDTLAYTITWLEMTAPPAGAPAPAPLSDLSLRRARSVPLHFFLYLYRAVGAPYEWTDMLDAPRDTVDAFIADERVETWVLSAEGVPAGFFMLDLREDGCCDLAYFGLVQGFGGRGFGRWLLDVALREGWSRPGVGRMTVNTCTLDHPAALPLYQRAGFTPIRREERGRAAQGPDYLGKLAFGWPRAQNR